MPHPVQDVVVFIPGLLGSRLRKAGRLIWGGASTLSTPINPEAALALDGDGFSVDEAVQPDGLVGGPSQFPGLAKVDAYDALVRFLHQSFELNSSNFVIFAYDWRLSCTVNARLLAERAYPVLRARRRQHPTARFVLLCHSLGGLVAQQFTDIDGAGEDTKEVITIGTPFRGAVKALGVLSQGWPAKLPWVRDRFRRLAQTFPSVYELLPRYRAIIEGNERRALAAGDLQTGVRAALYERSCQFHGALAAGGSTAYGRTVIVGTLQPTYQFAQIDLGVTKLYKEWKDAAGALTNERGDGTVPRQSVTPPPWVDDRHAIPFAQSHVGLPTGDGIFRIVRNVLTAVPRAEQSESRAKLTLEVPDLVATGEALDVYCEVGEGDKEVPVIVEVRRTDDAAMPRLQTPMVRDGGLVAAFPDLAPGDYRVTLRPATTMPDVAPVWDLVTVVAGGPDSWD